MARTRRVQRASAGARANRSWSGGVISGTTLPAVDTPTVLASGTILPGGVDLTVLRTRGVIQFAAGGTAGTIRGAIGYFISNSAVTSQVPGPITDVDFNGWYVWQPFSFEVGTATSSTATNAIHPFDSKAKRIIPSGYGIRVVIEMETTTANATVSVVWRELTLLRGTG